MTKDRRSTQICIAADDLTSATDGAVAFARTGHACEVLIDYKGHTFERCGLISINKDSRSLSSDEARERSRSVSSQLASADVLYQTMDSTLRGNIEAEILAALSGSGRSTALVAPAFPAAGRTTEGGEQKLDGVPVHLTAFGRDPTHPVERAHIRSLFPNLPDASIRGLSLQQVRAAQPGWLHVAGPTLVIADAVTQSDLDRLVAAIARPRDVLFCGSPGMARALATRFPGDGVERPVLPRVDRVLVVIGSANPTSAIQKAAILDLPGAVEIVVDAGAATSSPSAAARDAVDRARPRLDGAATMVVGTTALAVGRGDPGRVAEALARAAADVARIAPPDGLILTGGETAVAVLKGLRIPSIRLVAELEPGIPLGVADRPRPLVVLTKAGGFGSPDILAKAVAVLRSGDVGEFA